MARTIVVKNKLATVIPGQWNAPAGKRGTGNRSGPALHKTSLAFRQQVERSKYINQLAAQINQVVGRYAPRLKPSDFYQNLLRSFRGETVNNRFILLQGLTGRDINPKYPLSKLSEYKTTVKLIASNFVINLKVISDWRNRSSKNDCYYYEPILLTWDKTQGPPRHESQLSEWVYYSKGLPEFEFVFSKEKNIQHWLLLIHLALGVNEQESEALSAEAVQIADSGTFNKKDLILLAGKKEARNKKEIEEPAPDKPRKKAKSWSKR